METTRSWQVAAGRGLAVAAAALVVLASIQVMLTAPPPPPLYMKVPLLSQLEIMRYQFAPPEWRPWMVGMIAVSVLAQAAMAIALIRSSCTRASAWHLLVALGLGSFAWAWFGFVNATPFVRNGIVSPPLCIAADSLAAALGGYGAGLFARVFIWYPRVISEEEWAGNGAGTHAAGVREYRLLTHPRTPWVCAAITGFAPLLVHIRILVLGGSWSDDDLSPLLHSLRLAAGSVSQLPFLLIPMFGLAAAYRGVKKQAAAGVESQRRQFAWIYWPFAALNALFVVVLVALLAWAGLHLVMPDAPGAGALGQLPFLLPIFVPAIYTDVAMISLALSIFYHGAVDPKLAVGKISTWTFVVMALAFVFMLLERFAARWAVEFFGWSRDFGGIVAGAFTALTLGPLRKRTERGVQMLADRWQPVRPMEGQRATRTICFVDISGYSSVSMADEQRALLLSAILGRQAAAISHRHGGRVVKALGDAVICEFEDAANAVAAVQQIDAGFARACRTIEVEPLPLHCGIHTGEVTVTPQGDVFGTTVNLASRLQSLAAPGEIMLSGAAREAAGLDESALHALAPQSFKNFPEPVACYRLAGASA